VATRQRKKRTENVGSCHPVPGKRRALLLGGLQILSQGGVAVGRNSFYSMVMSWVSELKMGAASRRGEILGFSIITGVGNRPEHRGDCDAGLGGV